MKQGGGGIETVGAVLAVTEMLLQSYEGFIRLFPVWPNTGTYDTIRYALGRYTLFQDLTSLHIYVGGFFSSFISHILEPASFATLRAVGAFLVSANVDNTGAVSKVQVLSEDGQNCTLLSPWHPRGVQVTSMATGKEILVHAAPSDGSRVAVAGLWQWETERGVGYKIQYGT